MKNSVFLDTQGWISLLNATEQLHEHANELWLKLGESGCTTVLTDWIIAETGNGLARTGAKERFSETVNQLWQSPVVDIIIVDQALIDFHRVLQSSPRQVVGSGRLLQLPGDGRSRRQRCLYQ